MSRSVAALALTLSIGVGAARAQVVEIEYWQYTFPQRVKAINELITKFQQANPQIRVKHTDLPYNDYRTRIAAALPAGQGPDVMQLFYGWLGDYTRAKLLQPLPADVFPPARIDAEFFPMVREMKVDGQYYALPTAVRSLALFWNKRLFREAGLDPEKPPQTLDELVEMAKRLTRRDAGGNLTQAGMAVDPAAQDHHWWREVLVRQFGGTPYSADGRTVTYTSPQGLAATRFFADFFTTHRVAEVGFMTDQVTQFRSSRAALTIDGSFRLAAFDGQRGLEYGVTTLPTHNGIASNFGSYWVNAITTKATGAKRDAAARFLAYLVSPEAMELWLREVGELPARVEVASTPANANHPKYGPFIRGLETAVATNFVDETAQRQIMIDFVDRLKIAGASVEAALAEAARAEQALLDRANSPR
ncbi:MAG: extracellular solute-binding protein [Alphaproteobacteria bacterium]|nr:MAG: extracellular solute-binding protein [Alphaproteobacteria bacterium]